MRLNFAKNCLFERAILALVAIMFATHAESFAQAQTREELPPGYYIYLGPSPGNYPKQKFSIEGQGKVIWHEAGPKSKAASGEAGENGNSDVEVHWIRNQKGVIEWKPHAIPNLPDAGVKLTTDIVLGPGFSSAGTLRYKLVLSGVRIPPRNVQVQLLDRNGFKLKQYFVYQNQFLPSTKYENAFEANDQTPCNEKDYERARDYAVIAL